MTWNGFDPTWSKEFKDYAFYCLRNSAMAENAAEWLFELYCSHESMYEESWFPMNNYPTEAELAVYEKHVEALIIKSKELKMIRVFLHDMGEAHGYDYMKEFRKCMKRNYGIVIK